MARLRSDSERDGWSILAKDTDTPPYVSYSVYTCWSAATKDATVAPASFTTLFVAFAALVVCLHAALVITNPRPLASTHVTRKCFSLS